MNAASLPQTLKTREGVLYALYEASELEHNLMCTYLYAAFSLKDGESDGLSREQAEAVKRWRGVLFGVAIEEMGHLAAVWNITSALGGSPRIGRANFPIDPGYLPASVVVKLAPFSAATLQHFIFLERPRGSDERDGEGFVAERQYVRGNRLEQLTPQAFDYETVGDFYAELAEGLRNLVAQFGESQAFDGDPALQLSEHEVDLAGAKPVICSKTALAAFNAIVLQGEGAPQDSVGSHYQKFIGIRTELQALLAKNPDFRPAFPAATNPVLRRPPRPEGRVWLETPEATAAVDLANACYGLMLRLLAYSYSLHGPSAEKSLAVNLAIGLMQAVVPLAQRAARLPAGPSNPACNAGMSFTTLREAAPLPEGPAARRLFIERLQQLSAAAELMRASGDARALRAAEQLQRLCREANDGFTAANAAPATPAAKPAAPAPGASPAPIAEVAAGGGVEIAPGKSVEIQFEAKRCIHSRYCVTWAPNVFLANVQGPWIHPDAMTVEQVVEVAHACPSGAIRYRRLDGAADEAAPPVNLARILESGPYALRAPLRIDGKAIGYRATLCRCGASKNKPFCDGTHHEIGFAATGEPTSGRTEALAQRDGVLSIDPQPNGPLRVQGNLELISGTGRVVARVVTARLCRCGGSANKPFCDGTHAKIGFDSSK